MLGTWVALFGMVNPLSEALSAGILDFLLVLEKFHAVLKDALLLSGYLGVRFLVILCNSRVQIMGERLFVSV